MEERKICCCGAKTWTQVLAWLQIIGSGISAILCIYYLTVTSSRLRTIKEHEKNSKDLSQQNKDDFAIIKALFTTGIIYYALSLILLIASFVMGFILFIGSKNKNRGQLQAWIISAIVWWILWTGKEVLTFVYTGIWLIPSVGISLIVQVFTIWVVSKHKKEIEAYDVYDKGDQEKLVKGK